MKRGSLLSLSPQEGVDCATDDDGNAFGCGGGLPSRVVQFYMDHGVCKETTYPYVSGEGEDGLPCGVERCGDDEFPTGFDFCVEKNPLEQANCMQQEISAR